MTDIIKKAVELADGWNLDGDAFGYEPDNPHRLDDLKNIRQFELDALAAQLVRQVDATDYGIKLFGFGTKIYFGDAEYWEVCGKGRTMNTIKAIVDSGVLE